MKNFTITLTGEAPILMHNAQLSDKFNPITKAMSAINAKRTKKTDDDEWEMRRLEFVGGLYHDPDLGPYIPAENIEACLAKAAGLTRNGQDVKRGVRITTAAAPLVYDGPRDVDGLWNDGDTSGHVHFASVKVGQARIIRTRPIFRQWAVEFDGIIDPNILDPESLDQFIGKAGSMIGLGDWRPRFGTFTHELVVA